MGEKEDVLEKENVITEELKSDVTELSDDIQMPIEGEEVADKSPQPEAEQIDREKNKKESITEPIDCFDEEFAEETEIEKSEESIKKKSPFLWKKLLLGLGISVGAAGIIYGLGVLFYSNHFFFNTKIGDFDCSNLTVEAAMEKIKAQVDNYEFTLTEKNDVKEVITVKEIQMEYSPVENLHDLKLQQKPYKWLTDTDNRNLKMEIDVTFNKDTLYNRVTQIEAAAETRKNMKGLAGDIYYENGKYHVKDDGTKNIISINNVYQTAKQKIHNLSTGMSLEDEGLYVGLANEDTIKGVLNLANKYVGTVVTYTRGEEKTVLNGDTINEWITIDDNYSVHIDSDKIREYVNNLVKPYDTVGKDRKFKTTGGSEVTISGGNYGWLTDSARETAELKKIIESGETVTREPVYKKTAAAHGKDNDISNTYVEISLSGQHLWFYKNGELVTSTDFVSGDPTKGNATPSGVYSLTYKEKDTVLVGEDYRSPVKFWMPFNGGIGLHDASWRGSFGGSIYNGSGSHGCVNLPYSAASAMYEKISSGDPIVVY